MLRALALLIILLVTIYCWVRVFSKQFRRKYRIWWLSLSNVDNDSLDLLASLIGAFLTMTVFIYIAGLGYWWK